MSIWNKFKSKFEGVGKNKTQPRFSVTKKEGSKEQGETPAKKSSQTEKDTSNEKTNAAKQVKQGVLGTVSYTHIVRQPLLTEKATLAKADNKHVFEVAVGASKYEIKKAIRQAYGVTPTKINVLNFEGKTTRWGRREGRQRDWRKVYVTLPKGTSIETHKGISKE